MAFKKGGKKIHKRKLPFQQDLIRKTERFRLIFPQHLLLRVFELSHQYFRIISCLPPPSPEAIKRVNLQMARPFASIIFIASNFCASGGGQLMALFCYE